MALYPNSPCSYRNSDKRLKTAMRNQLTPEVPGVYRIYAVFDGSNSYWGSQAESVISVTAAHATTAPTQPPVSTVEQYFLPAIVGVIIAVVVVGAVISLIFSKKT